MKYLLRGVLAAALFTGAAIAAQGQAAAVWSTGTPLPLARSEMRAAVVNGKVYLIGGAWMEMKNGKPVENYTTGFTTEFDPQSKTWRERARAPEGLTHQALAVLNGKIYAAGGFAAHRHTLTSSGFFAYDPATDKWQRLAPLPGKRGAVGLAAVGGVIHVIAGRETGDVTFGTHDVYNPATNTWKPAAPLPTARDHSAVFVVDGKIHVIGGRLGDTPDNVALHDVYDPATDKWTPAPPLPTARSSVAFAQYRDMLFVAGGECRKTGGTFDEVEAYDLKTNRWVKFPPLPKARHAFTAAAIGDKLYFFGGSLECGGAGKTAETLVLTAG
jgi:N-acetylneuraminic acid mutarotase